MMIHKRFRLDINTIFFFVPLLLLPLAIEGLGMLHYYGFYHLHQGLFLMGNILYIVIVRFIFLDSMLYVFSHSPHPTHVTLIRIVMLYLEITIVTILYFAVMYYLFDVFSLFHFSGTIASQSLASMKEHSFITSFYISAVTFTTLGSGDWIPQNIHSMIAVSAEAILGVVQSGVFVAILIYSHQNKTASVSESAK